MADENTNLLRILELADQLNRIQRTSKETALYQLPPFPTDDRVPLVSGLEVVQSAATSGATKVALRWTRPANPDIDHFEVWVQRTAFQNENPYQAASVDDSPAAFTITSDEDTAAVIYVRTVLTSGLSTDLKASPTCAVNVYKFVATAADIANGAVGDSKLDRISGDKIVIQNADIISTLTVGGGSGMPGVINVYDGTPAIVAKIGDQGSSYFGIWGKNVWVGGSGRATAPFYVDSSGNVVIDNTGTGVTATFKLVSNDLTTELNNQIVGLIPQALVSRWTVGGVDIKVLLSAGALLFLDLNTTNDIVASYGQNSLSFLDAATNNTLARVDQGITNASNSALYLAPIGSPTTLTKLSTYDGLTIANANVITIAGIADFTSLKIGGTEIIDSSGNVKSQNGVASFTGAVTSITITNGIVTAIS